MKAIQAMTRNVICIREVDTLQTAFDLMKEWDIRHLPVTTDGKLVGVISDRDILPYSMWSDSKVFLSRSVSDSMSRRVIAASPDDPISQIAGLMISHKIDCIPIVDPTDRELIGLVTSMDLVDLLREREILDLSRSVPWDYKIHSSV